MSWFCKESGDGRPLVLLHGIGMSHQAWDTVAPFLSAQRRVLAFDVAGFGKTPALSGPLTPARLIDGLRDSLEARGITEPVDIVGNSMGGWLTLHAAVAGLARTITCLSPAGLVPAGSAPWHVAPTFAAARFAARHLPGVSSRLLGSPVARSLALAVPVSPFSYRMPAASARRCLEDFANAPGFQATYDIIDQVDGLDRLTLPMTIAFGKQDWILTGAMQSRALLPRQARWLQPSGWGHVPMWDDPRGVAALILESSGN